MYGPRQRCTAVLGLLFLIALPSAGLAQFSDPGQSDSSRTASMTDVPTRLTRQPDFGIPFQVAPNGPVEPVEIRLYVSSDRGENWKLFDRQPLSGKRFQFSAPDDGEYWFAVRTIDRQGQFVHEQPWAPELKVVVDTRRPRLELRVDVDAQGIRATWHAEDPNLAPHTFRLQYLEPSGEWSDVRTRTPDEHDWRQEWGGEVEWFPGKGTEAQVRAEVLDRAGNATSVSRRVSLAAFVEESRVAANAVRDPGLNEQTSRFDAYPIQDDRLRVNPAASRSTDHPFPRTDRDDQAWRDVDPPADRFSDPSADRRDSSLPSRNESPSRDRATAPGTPPASERTNMARRNFQDQFDTTQRRGGTPSENGQPGANSWSEWKDIANRSLGGDWTEWWGKQAQGATKVPPGGASGAISTHQPWTFPGPSVSSDKPVAQDRQAYARGEMAPPVGSLYQDASARTAVNRALDSGLDSPAVPPPDSARTRVTASPNFGLDYDLYGIGTEGPVKIELWYTQDRGQSWHRYGEDTDRQTPFEVRVQEQGVYGFRLLVHGKGLAPPAAPQAGEQADMWVNVDWMQPTGRILDARLEKDLEPTMVIEWQASDALLTDRPISILFAESAQGPWQPVARDLRNSGSYHWKLDGEPTRPIFLQLEIRDQAGNVTTVPFGRPVSSEGTAPRAEIRNVLPLEQRSTTALRPQLPRLPRR